MVQRLTIIIKLQMSHIYKNPPKSPHIEVKVSTWAKDSHGLYEYEAAEDAYKVQTFFMESSGKLVRQLDQGNTVLDSSNMVFESAAYAAIAEIIFEKSKVNPEFKIKPLPVKEVVSLGAVKRYKTPHLVVRDFTKNGIKSGYPLKPGNVIKLGRVEYMVIQSKNQEETQTLRNTNHFEEANGVYQIKKGARKKEEERNCKICLCNEETEDDPLISPCNCKGSCRTIHVGCLKTWINSKIKKELKGIAVSYNFSKFQCEICKFPFPQIVRFQDRDIEMMTITKPNKPYIILESQGSKQENRQERCLHLISTEENKPIKIGREYQCEIRVTDISVSRKHAEITLQEGEFYITDNKSKFGTLIKFQEEITLTPNCPVKIQCGRSVYEFRAKYDMQQDQDTE